jgi:hypothetical protein
MVSAKPRNRNIASVLLGAAGVVAGAGCASAQGSFSYSAAMRGCTQEDAPALEVYLAPAPAPPSALDTTRHIRLEIGWGNWRDLVAKDVELLPLARSDANRSKPLVRAFFRDSTGRTEWLRGTLRLAAVEEGSTVRGTYDFIGAGQRALRGTFQAPWIQRSVICG